MKAIDLNARLIDSYINLVKNLNVSAKLDLIAKLTQSLKNSFDKKNNSFDEAFGAWDSNESGEKLAKSLRESRRFNRRISNL
jgi:hypothetical protein